ncbi:hypothetical protein C8238_03445, partial [Paracidovorax avenae]
PRGLRAERFFGGNPYRWLNARRPPACRAQVARSSSRTRVPPPGGASGTGRSPAMRRRALRAMGRARPEPSEADSPARQNGANMASRCACGNAGPSSSTCRHHPPPGSSDSGTKSTR